MNLVLGYHMVIFDSYTDHRQNHHDHNYDHTNNSGNAHPFWFRLDISSIINHTVLVR
ncbi:MAG: hypothetical protein V4553_09195 [Bacteroidota bacterium]